jgi:hypothetical protein
MIALAVTIAIVVIIALAVTIAIAVIIALAVTVARGPHCRWRPPGHP